MDASREMLARIIDHTLLTTDATPAQVSALVAEARELGTFSVCVSPSMLPLTDDLGPLKVATVCGFPSGNHTPTTKAAEAAESSRLGADEIDMVINTGYLKAGEPHLVAGEIAAVRAATSGLLKVIIESAALTDEEIVAACQAAEEAGADFVKTSTGFHPAGGATVHAVELMAASATGPPPRPWWQPAPPGWACPPAAPSWRVHRTESAPASLPRPAAWASSRGDSSPPRAIGFK